MILKVEFPENLSHNNSHINPNNSNNHLDMNRTRNLIYNEEKR